MEKERKYNKFYSSLSGNSCVTSSVSVLMTSSSMTGGNSVPPITLS